MANPLRQIAELPVKTIQAVAGGGDGRGDAAAVRSELEQALRPLSAKIDALQKELKQVRSELREIREDTDHIRTEQARVAAES